MTQEARTGEKTGGPSSVPRFSLRQRVEHWVVVLLFFLLVLTGLPQKFSQTGWAGWVVWGLGGLDVMRWLHRMVGLLFSVFTTYFLGYIILDILRGRMAPSMVPMAADLREALESLLWYAGLRPRPPASRFDYRQKFEFWGMLFGSVLMVATGLMLYFPLETTRWLPGQSIPVAKTAHSNEALLALLVIVVWHLYNTVLRPSVFPLDRSMVSGRMPLERLREEHSLEYARLFPEDTGAGGGPAGSREASPPLERPSSGHPPR